MCMEKELRLNVITPFGIEYDAYIKEVVVSENSGLIGFLRDYAPTMGKVKRGILHIVNSSNSVEEYIIDDGVFSVSSNLLKIITNFFIKNTDEEKQKVATLRKESLDCLNAKNKSHYTFKIEIALFKNIKEIKN